MRIASGILAIAVALAVAVPAVHAQNPGAKKRATKLVREAAQLYQDGDRLGAVRKFEDAYKIYPSAAILYNLGTAYRGVGRDAKAHRALTKFLRIAKKVSPKRIAAVKQTLRSIETVVGRVIVSVAARGMTVLIDGSTVGVSPLADPVAVPPGVHQVSLEKDGKELAKKTVAAGAGAQVEVKFFAIATSTKVKPKGSETGTTTGVPTPKQAARGVGDPSPLTTTQKKRESKSVLGSWWFWTAVGAVVLTGTALAISGGGDTVNDINPTLGQFDFGQF